MRTPRLLLALLLVAPSALARPTSSAPVDRSVIPAGGPAPPLKLPKPARFKLSSGAEVLVVERRTLPMAVIAVVWPFGAADEPLAEAGISGLTADLLDEGTTKHGALALAEELDSLGANIDSGSGWDSTVVSLTSLTKNLDRTLPLLAEVVATPAFDDKELARKRADRLTALLQQKDSASAVAGDVLARLLYGTMRRYGAPLLGSEPALARATRDDVLAWFHARLRPERATVIVTGAVSVEEARKLLESAFASWKLPAAKPIAALTMPSERLLPARAIVDKPGAPQSEVRVGEPGVPRDSPDYFPLIVMNAVLGGQFSSRLNLNLREEHGYTYGARSDFAFRKAGGPFVVATAAKTQVTGPTLVESFKELSRIRTEPVSDKELHLAHDLLERAMARRFETLGDVSSELAQQVVYRLPDDYFATWSDKVQSVTAADVQRVAKDHLDPSQLSIVVVGDKSVVLPQLTQEKLGDFTLYDNEGKPISPAITH